MKRSGRSRRRRWTKDVQRLLFEKPQVRTTFSAELAVSALARPAADDWRPAPDQVQRELAMWEWVHGRD